MNYKEIEGDLITLALEGNFDVIAHGCNCFCKMGAGIAPQMAEAFKCNNFEKEAPVFKGDINKLGTIDTASGFLVDGGIFMDFDGYYRNEDNLQKLVVVNSYTQFNYGRNHTDGDKKPLDYEALILCLRKINHIFKGKRVGLPQIGAGLAGGDWDTIKAIIQHELRGCHVTVVIYKK